MCLCLVYVLSPRFVHTFANLIYSLVTLHRCNYVYKYTSISSVLIYNYRLYSCTAVQSVQYLLVREIYNTPSGLQISERQN